MTLSNLCRRTGAGSAASAERSTTPDPCSRILFPLSSRCYSRFDLERQILIIIRLLLTIFHFMQAIVGGVEEIETLSFDNSRRILYAKTKSTIQVQASVIRIFIIVSIRDHSCTWLTRAAGFILAAVSRLTTPQ